MANEAGETVQEAVEQKIEDGKNMSVKIYSPFKVYFDGLALSASAESKTGPFDILPKHHNFITLLEPCDLLIRVEGQDDEVFPIGGGIMHVKADQVTVFLDV
jgi:F0F1-type ATP synthase epsilon subunit